MRDPREYFPGDPPLGDCVDCSIPSTFISTREGGVFRIELEADEFGDEFRTATVERCAGVIKDSEGVPVCESPVEVSLCQDHR